MHTRSMSDLLLASISFTFCTKNIVCGLSSSQTESLFSRTTLENGKFNGMPAFSEDKNMVLERTTWLAYLTGKWFSLVVILHNGGNGDQRELGTDATCGNKSMTSPVREVRVFPRRDLN